VPLEYEPHLYLDTSEGQLYLGRIETRQFPLRQRWKRAFGSQTFCSAAIECRKVLLWVIIVILGPWPDVRSSPVSDRDSDFSSGL
jgi:hypothetical protein